MSRLRCAGWFCCWAATLMMTGCGANSANSISPANTSTSGPAEKDPHFSQRYAAPTATPPAEAMPATAPPQATIASDQGVGPGQGGDRYDYLAENQFVAVRDEPLSTFSIDVDTASFSKSRMYLMQQGVLPPVDAVRIEEFVNYFSYDYPAPRDGEPFAIHLEVADCPWQPKHQLARIALKGREIDRDRPPCNLVFLIDVSGSMASPQRIGLVKQSLRMLTSQLTDRDSVAIVVYASREGLVLPATKGDRHTEILAALEQLEAGGATNGGAGIRLAYSVAKSQLIQDGVNRVILCTDGDFNVGTTSTGELVRLAESEATAGVFLTILGFGMGNHNDAMLEEISNKANGTYAFLDNEAEARKVFIDQIDGTLVTIAKDVKIQVEFNPAHIGSYRLIGYENRLLAARDFNDDRKDAGDVGAGHTVTALYELIPVGAEDSQSVPRVDPLKYQPAQSPAIAADPNELLTFKLRYKEPNANRSQLLTATVRRETRRFSQASTDFRFAASVAAFGMLLRRSPQAGDIQFDGVLEIARAATGNDARGYRRDFLEMIQTAQRLSSPSRAAAVFVTPSWVSPNPPLSAPLICGAPISESTLVYLAVGLILFLVANIYAGFIVSGFVYWRIRRTKLSSCIVVPVKKPM